MRQYSLLNSTVEAAVCNLRKAEGCLRGCSQQHPIPKYLLGTKLQSQKLLPVKVMSGVDEGCFQWIETWPQALPKRLAEVYTDSERIRLVAACKHVPHFTVVSLPAQQLAFICEFAARPSTVCSGPLKLQVHQFGPHLLKFTFTHGQQSKPKPRSFLALLWPCKWQKVQAVQW